MVGWVPSFPCCACAAQRCGRLHLSPSDVREWDGPAVLPPCQRGCWWGNSTEGAPRHVPQDQRLRSRNDWHRPRKEYVPPDRSGRTRWIVLREKVARNRVLARLANVPSCLIGIEAGMGTHCVTPVMALASSEARNTAVRATRLGAAWTEKRRQS